MGRVHNMVIGQSGPDLVSGDESVCHYHDGLATGQTYWPYNGVLSKSWIKTKIDHLHHQAYTLITEINFRM